MSAWVWNVASLSVDQPAVRTAVTAFRPVAPTAPRPDLTGLPLIDTEFVSSQRSAGRLLAHAAGRAALAHLLEQSGLDPLEHSVSRNTDGAPLLHPASVVFSIAHDESLAVAVTAAPSMRLGVDVEAATRRVGDAVLPQIAAGAELTRLLAAVPSVRLDAWLAKEAVCKAAGVPLDRSAKLVELNLDPISLSPSPKPGDDAVEVSRLAVSSALFDGARYDLSHLTHLSGDSEHRLCIAFLAG